MIKQSPPVRPLGTAIARLLRNLARSGKSVFVFEDALKRTKTNYNATANLLAKLIKKNEIARIKNGTYLILQTGVKDIQLKNWPIIAREMASPKPYFISHYSAMRIHGMTSHALTDVHITIAARISDKKLKGLQYRFVYSKKEHFWGMTIHGTKKQNQFRVSDLERTILDGLDRPDLCGGIIDVVRGIWVKQKEIKWLKLAQYGKRFKNKAAVKRLGFIIETLEIGNQKFTEQIQAVAKKAKGYALFDPHGNRTGGYINRWGLLLNANREELRESIWG